MPKIEYEPKVSLGNLLVALPVFLALAGGWTAITGRVSVVEARQDAIQHSVEVIAESVKESEQRSHDNYSDLRAALGRVDDHLLNLQIPEKHRGNEH